MKRRLPFKSAPIERDDDGRRAKRRSAEVLSPALDNALPRKVRQRFTTLNLQICSPLSLEESVASTLTVCPP
jgi:hypothetical protein